jgi:hypothetical protein
MKVVRPIIPAEFAVGNTENLAEKFLVGGLLRDKDAFVSGVRNIRRGIVGRSALEILEVISNRRIVHQYGRRRLKIHITASEDLLEFSLQIESVTHCTNLLASVRVWGT